MPTLPVDYAAGAGASGEDAAAKATGGKLKGEQRPTLHEVIDSLGFGFAQVKVCLLGGGIWLADGAELLLISGVAKAVSVEWELGPVQRGSLVTIVFFGVMLGNLSGGPLGDGFGRRWLVLASYAGIAAFSILSSLTSGFATLALVRLLVGASIGLGQPAGTTLGSETLPAYWRVLMSTCNCVLFTAGEVFSAFLLLVDDPGLQDVHWRPLLRWGALPAGILLVLGILFLHESPTFLSLEGRFADATAVLESMRWANRAEGTPVAFRPPPPAGAASPGTPVQDSLRRQLAIVFGRAYLGTTLIVAYSCFVLNLLYNGCLYAWPQVLPMVVKGSSPAAELLIGSLWELPGYALGFGLGMVVSRKRGGQIPLALCTISLLAFVAGTSTTGKTWLSQLLLYGGYYGTKCFPCTGFVIMYQYAVEVYPTEARITGAGVNFAAGRLASMLAPIVFEQLFAATGDFRIFFLGIAASCPINYVLINFLPFETAGVHLKDRADANVALAEGAESAPSYGAVAA